jgi:hypothetical protein
MSNRCMELVYHLKAFDLIGHQPELIRHDLLDEFSVKSGLEMPKAVKEFYGVRDAMDLLGNFSNCDQPLSPDQFDVITIGGKPAIAFLVENQGCCTWAFQLDGTGDPPVWVDEGAARESPKWSATTATFSKFVFLRFFDFQYFTKTLATADEYYFDTKPVTQEALFQILRPFQQEDSTYDWPSATKHRFWRNDQRIVIFTMSDYSEWQLFAATKSSRETLLAEVKQLCNELSLEPRP